jgi:isoamylase
MTPAEWADSTAHSIALFIDGSTDPDVAPEGTPMVDNDFLILVNAWWEPLTFAVPGAFALHNWEIVSDSFDPTRNGQPEQQIDVGPRSAVVLRSGN